MSTQEVIEQVEALPRSEQASVARRVLETLCCDNKFVERIMRRIENPDIPEDVWRGIEEAEDGRLMDLDEALTELDRP
jgi:hypothetical protein